LFIWTPPPLPISDSEAETTPPGLGTSAAGAAPPPLSGPGLE
jgi:hypothetical protein